MSDGLNRKVTKLRAFLVIIKLDIILIQEVMPRKYNLNIPYYNQYYTPPLPVLTTLVTNTLMVVLKFILNLLFLIIKLF